MKRLVGEIVGIVIITVAWSFIFNAVSGNGIALIGKEEDFRLKTEADGMNLALAVDGFYAGTLFFVDCRYRDVYECGHIPGAFSIPYNQIEEMVPGFLAAYPPGLAIVTYCDGTDCDASVIVANNLKKMGFERIHIFSGGWDEWVQSGHPVDMGPGISY